MFMLDLAVVGMGSAEYCGLAMKLGNNSNVTIEFCWIWSIYTGFSGRLGGGF